MAEEQKKQVDELDVICWCIMIGFSFVLLFFFASFVYTVGIDVIFHNFWYDLLHDLCPKI